MFVCFPISSCLPPLRVSLRVAVYHIMLPLFWCSQFILLPCHPIMCCANRVLLCLSSEWMMELSHSRTRVSVCSFIRAAAQAHTFQFGLWKVFSACLLFFWPDGAVSLLLIPCLLFFIFHSRGFPYPVNVCISYLSAIPFSLG